MKRRLKIISTDRAIHIIDALLLQSGEWIDESTLTDRVKKLLLDLHMVAHTCSRPSCEDVHQHWIPDIRKMESELIKNGFCAPLNRRGYKARMKEQKRNKAANKKLFGHD